LSKSLAIKTQSRVEPLPSMFSTLPPTSTTTDKILIFIETKLQS